MLDLFFLGGSEFGSVLIIQVSNVLHKISMIANISETFPLEDYAMSVKNNIEKQ